MVIKLEIKGFAANHTHGLIGHRAGIGIQFDVVGAIGWGGRGIHGKEAGSPQFKDATTTYCWVRGIPPRQLRFTGVGDFGADFKRGIGNDTHGPKGGVDGRVVGGGDDSRH